MNQHFAISISTIFDQFFCQTLTRALPSVGVRPLRTQWSKVALLGHKGLGLRHKVFSGELKILTQHLENLPSWVFPPEITLQDSSFGLLWSTETCHQLAFPCIPPVWFFSNLHPPSTLFAFTVFHLYPPTFIQGTNASSFFCLLLSVSVNIGCLLSHEVSHSFVLSFGRRVNQHYLSSLKAVNHLLVTLITYICPRCKSDILSKLELLVYWRKSTLLLK